MIVNLDIAVIGKDIVRHSLKNRFSKHGKHHRILLYESMILMYIVIILIEDHKVPNVLYIIRI
jgi:hypothetical protein